MRLSGGRLARTMAGLPLTSHGRCTRLRSPVVFLPGLACTYTPLKDSLLSTSDRFRVGILY